MEHEHRVSPFKEKVKQRNHQCSLFDGRLGTDYIHVEVEGKEPFRKRSASVSLHYSVFTQFCLNINIWPFTVLFLFFMNNHSPYLFLLHLLLMLFCYAFTTPFLNKVFLELYTGIVRFVSDTIWIATASSVCQIAICTPFSKAQQKRDASALRNV